MMASVSTLALSRGRRSFMLFETCHVRSLLQCTNVGEDDVGDGEGPSVLFECFHPQPSYSARMSAKRPVTAAAAAMAGSPGGCGRRGLAPFEVAVAGGGAALPVAAGRC